MNEKSAMITEFLTQTGTASPNVMIIFSAKNPENLDTTVFSRISENIKFRTLSQSELEAMIKQNIEYFFTHDPMIKTFENKFKKLDVSILQNDQLIADIAAQLKEHQFDGCDIYHMIDILRNELFENYEFELKNELLNKVIQDKINKKKYMIFK